MQIQAQRLEIEERVDNWDIGLASLDRFRYRKGALVDGEVIFRPNITPYCLDDKKRRVIFTETDPAANLEAAAFYHNAQFQHARCLYTLSYEDVNQLADQLGSPFERLIWVHSTGRCGSTLLSRALGEMPTVHSLSEPDMYTQVVFTRPANGKRDTEFAALLRSCTRLLYHANGEHDTLAVKFRSQCIEIAPLLMEAFPEAKNVYLYRHAETWAQSAARAFGILDKESEASQRWGKPTLQNIKMFSRMVPLAPQYMLKTRTVKLQPLEFMALMWVSNVLRYQELDAQGVAMFATRFATLTAAPRAVLSALFAWCDLPLADLDRALVAFGQDSQRGSSIARDKVYETTLTAEQVDTIGKVLAHHGIFSADYTLPNTYTPPLT